MKKEIIFESLKLIKNCNLSPTLSTRTKYKKIVKFAYKKFGKHIKKFINYNHFALEFNQEFFFKNYLKNLYFYDHLYNLGYRPNSNILDVGCGAAPASIALYQLASIYKESTDLPQIHLIDKSYRQLDLARLMGRTASIPLKSARKEVFIFRETLYNEMLVFSYFVSEQERSFIKTLYSNRNSLKYGFAVIDYKYIVDRIKKTFDENGDHGIHVFYLHINLPTEFSNFLNENEIHIYGCYYENAT